MFYWIQTLALYFYSGSKHLILMRVSKPINESTQGTNTEKTYDESGIRTRQKQRIVTPVDPYCFEKQL